MQAKDMRNNAWNKLKGKYWMLFLGSLLVNLVLGAANMLSLVLIGPATVGLNFYYINANRGKEPQLEDIIDPFKDRFVETMIAGLLKNVFIFLWTLLFIIPGLVKTYSYFLTEYLMVFDKDIKGQDAITKSTVLMHGHKGRLFYLHLTFIGWFILGILTFGIGLIFILPYVKMAEVEFALDLLKQHNTIEDISFNDSFEDFDDDEIIINI